MEPDVQVVRAGDLSDLTPRTGVHHHGESGTGLVILAGVGRGETATGSPERGARPGAFVSLEGHPYAPQA